MQSPIQPFQIVSPQPQPMRAQQIQQCSQPIGQFLALPQQPQNISSTFPGAVLPIISGAAPSAQPGFVQAPPASFLQSQGQPIRQASPGIPLQSQQYPGQQQLPPISSFPQSRNMPQSPSQLPPMQVCSQQLPLAQQFQEQPNFQQQLHQEQFYSQQQPPRSSSPAPFSQIIRVPMDYQQSSQQHQQQQYYPTQPSSGQFISANPTSAYGQNNLTQTQNVEIVNQQQQTSNNLRNPLISQKGFVPQDEQQQQQQYQQFPQNIAIPNTQQVPNPMLTYQQQLAVHQQQQEQLNQIQSRNPRILGQQQQQQSYYQPQAQLDSQQYHQRPDYPPQKPCRSQSPQNHFQPEQYPIYNAGKDCEEKLFQLIQENQALIAENEYYKKHLSSLQHETQDSIILGQQVHALRKQVQSLQQQLQIQTDDAIMWANREKELADRCRSLYEQLQNAQGQQQESATVDKNSNQTSKITSQQQQSEQSTQQEQYQQQLPSKKAASPRAHFQTLPETLNQQELENDVVSNKNPYSYASPKQREDLVQSIIKQYKLGGQLPSESYTKTVNRSQSHGRENNKTNQKDEDIIRIQEENSNDWKTKYDSLTKKLNGLNALSNSVSKKDTNGQNSERSSKRE